MDENNEVKAEVAEELKTLLSSSPRRMLKEDKEIKAEVKGVIDEIFGRWDMNDFED